MIPNQDNNNSKSNSYTKKIKIVHKKKDGTFYNKCRIIFKISCQKSG